MTPQRHREAMDLFDAVCELDAAARERFLIERCGGDTELRREVESLLRADEGAAGQVDAGDSGGAARLLAVDLFGQERFGRATVAAAHAAQSQPSIALQRIGHYRIVRKIGEGGMGVVYEAEQDNPRRIVALKVI